MFAITGLVDFGVSEWIFAPVLFHAIQCHWFVFRLDYCRKSLYLKWIKSSIDVKNYLFWFTYQVFPSHKTHSGMEKAQATHTDTLTITIFLEPSILHRLWTCANCTPDQGKQNMLCRMQLVSGGREARRTFSALVPLYRGSFKFPCHPSLLDPAWSLTTTLRVRWNIYHWFD